MESTSEHGANRGGKIHYLRHAGPERVLCYAPTRSGKGVGLIVPTLLSWKQSVFVTDLKGELYELTAGWRHEYGHNKILRFEPARRLVPAVLTRWMNCALGPSTK
jgi:type IV secretion system protein VirD4